MSNPTVPSKNPGDLLLASEVNDFQTTICTKQDLVSPSALTRVSDTNVILTLGGTPATSLLQATSLTLSWSGTLSIARGGRNDGTALNNNRVIVSTSGTIVETAAITVNRAIISNGSGLPIHSSTTATEIGYVNGVTSAIQTQLDARDTTEMTINTQAGDYTLVLGDAKNNFLELTKGTAGTLTIPTNASVAIPIGSTVSGYAAGAGQITITAAGGVSLRSADGALKTRVQYSTFSLLKVAINTWTVTGDLTT